jgi:molybdopterin converting factor small subunit
MIISVKLFAYFRDNRFKIKEYDIDEGMTVGDIVDDIAIDREEVGVLMINSRQTNFDVQPVEKDILAIFPVIGGG